MMSTKCHPHQPLLDLFPTAVLAQQSEFDAVSYFTLSQLPIQHGLTEPGIEIQGKYSIT